MGEVLATNPSSSNPNVLYRIIKGADGIVYCDCPGWKMRKSCKHLVAFTGGAAPAAPVASSKPKKAITKIPGVKPGDVVSPTIFASDEFQSLGWYQGCGVEVAGRISDMITALEKYEKEGKYVAESKCDGIWIAAFSDGNTVRFWSRNCLEKQYGLSTLKIPAGTLLIGELGFGSEYALGRRSKYGYDFMDVFGILYEDYKPLFDLDETERRKRLETFMDSLDAKTRKQFMMVPRISAKFSEMFTGEHEGLVLKLATGPETKYIGNKNKVNHWMKVKKWYETDMVIIDIRVSDAKTKTLVPMTKDLIVGQYVGGVLTPLTKVGGGIPDDLSKDLVANFDKKYKGKVIKIAHYGQFKSGALRHAEVLDPTHPIRDDKDPTECVFDPNQSKEDESET